MWMDVPRISRFGQVPVALKQEDRNLGCIPTNLAVVLQAYGVPSNVATEGNLARAYQSTINFGRVQAEVLQKTQGMLGYDLSPFRLVHEPGIKRFNDWCRRALKRSCSLLICPDCIKRMTQMLNR
jgi:hypothetical protein